MAESRDDFVIAVRSAFLKKSNKQTNGTSTKQEDECHPTATITSLYQISFRLTAMPVYSALLLSVHNLCDL